MRITEKNDRPYSTDIYDVKINEYDCKNCSTDTSLSACLDKLGKLEDVEEEHGIDLIVFSKLLSALDKGFVYVKVRKIKQYTGYAAIEETGKIEQAFITRFSRYINGTRDWFFTIYSVDTSIATNYLLEDYGVTWANSREELEKPKENHL